MEFKKIQDEKKESLLMITYDNIRKIKIQTGCVVTYTAKGGTIDTTHAEEFLKCVDEEGNIHYYNSELKEVDNFKPLDKLWLWDYPNPDKAKRVQLMYNSNYEIVRTVLS